MGTPFINALLSAVVVSLIAFSGILFLAIKMEALQKIVFVLVSFAVGALFGSAFFVLVPESYEIIHNPLHTGLMVVAGIMALFILEKFIHWRHDHDVEGIKKEDSLGYISLVTDGLHNFIDGVLIAAAWATSPEIGLATTLSVIIHEVPQEISDFGILIYAGFTKKKALFFNFLAAVSTIIGVIFTFWLGRSFENITNYFLPFAAGGFIYLAGSDLIPHLNQEKSMGKNITQFFVIIIGLLMMLFISQSHSHTHSNDTSHIHEHTIHDHGITK